MINAITEAKRWLDQGGCTLVVVNGDVVRRFSQRGVADLVDILAVEPGLLFEASVADKVVGKAAASLMIEGRLREVFSRVMTHDALRMFADHGIEASYGSLVDMVINRRGDGRCPLDTICATLHDTKEIKTAIINFITKKR